MSDKHLVFFTNSTVGVEISSDPQSANPVKFVLGYKRQEGLIDPIAKADHCVECPQPVAATKHDEWVEKGLIKCTTTSDGVEEYCHSVLAKFNFGATTSGTGASAAQWFASGRAAEILARQPGITGAISGDAEVARAAALVAQSDDGGVGMLATLQTAYKAVKKVADSTDPRAADSRAVIASVAHLDAGEFRTAFTEYTLPEDKTFVQAEFGANPSGAPSFQNVLDYLSRLDQSASSARSIVVESRKKKDSTSDLSLDERARIFNDSCGERDRYTQLEKSVLRDKDVVGLVKYWFEHVLTTSDSTR